MVKFFKNGVLEVDTLDLPQDCGDIKVSVTLEEERDDANYYLEFSCPRNVKYISQKLVRTGDREYEINLPRGISDYIGEVYVQLVIMSVVDATLISRSLVARTPLFVIKESILASVTLDSSEKRDFFEYAENVIGNAEDKIGELVGEIAGIPNKIDDKVTEKMQIIDNLMTNYESEINGIVKKIGDDLSEFSTEVNSSLVEHNESLTNIESNISNLSDDIVNINNDIQEHTSNITANTTQINEVQSSVASNANKIASVESSLQTKMDKANVVNDFVSNTEKVYSSNYINSKYGKRLIKGSGKVYYTCSTSYAKRHTFNCTYNGIMIMTVTSFLDANPIDKIGICHQNKSIMLGTTCNLASPINQTMSATVALPVKNGDAFDMYVACRGSSMTNTLTFDYIIWEE